MSELPPTLPALDGVPDPLAGEARPVLPPLPSSRGLPPSRTRAELGRAQRVALAVSLAWFGVQLAVLGVRGDLPEVSFGYLVALAGAPVVAGGLCVVSAVSAGRLGLGARVGLLAALSLLSPAAFVLGATLGPAPHPAAPDGDFRSGVVCFNIALAWTVLPLVLAGFALRGAFVAGAVWRSAALATGAGLAAAAAITLHCPTGGSLHVGLGHGGAILASALFGAFVLSRVTRA